MFEVHHSTERCLTELSEEDFQNTFHEQYIQGVGRFILCASKGELEESKKLAQSLLELTGTHQRFNLGVPVCFVMGTMYLERGMHDVAIAMYARSCAFAEVAINQSHPNAFHLKLQASMGLASAFIAASQFEKAVRVYERISVPLAKELEDTRFEFESYRMAAYCRERLKQTDRAWEQAEKALEIAQSVEPEKLKEQEVLPLEKHFYQSLRNGLIMLKTFCC